MGTFMQLSRFVLASKRPPLSYRGLSAVSTYPQAPRARGTMDPGDPRNKSEGKQARG